MAEAFTLLLMLMLLSNEQMLSLGISRFCTSKWTGPLFGQVLCFRATTRFSQVRLLKTGSQASKQRRGLALGISLEARGIPKRPQIDQYRSRRPGDAHFWVAVDRRVATVLARPNRPAKSLLRLGARTSKRLSCMPARHDLLFACQIARRAKWADPMAVSNRWPRAPVHELQVV